MSSSFPPIGAAVSYLSWQERRREMPQFLRDSDTLTDLTLVARCARTGRDVEFRAHRLLLACHSEYFLHLLSSGMREAEEGLVRFGGDVEAAVLEAVLSYVYTGEVPLAAAESFEASRSLLLAANMWQMGDLEAAVVRAMADRCGSEPRRCLKMFLFVRDVDEAFCCGSTGPVAAAQQNGSENGSQNGSSNGSSSRESTVAAARRELETMLVKIVRDQWHVIVSQPEENEDGEEDDYVSGLVDLDLPSLKVILSIKSDQEDIGDFSFSFNQTDLAHAVVAWVRADLHSRHSHFQELSEFFCHHQVSASAKEALRKLTRDIDTYCSVHPASPVLGRSEESSALPPCVGFWCPRRRIPGLLIAHAWSPHANNKLTSDHVFFYFTIPEQMSESEKSRPLHEGFFYDLGQFGDLGQWEKHLLQPNACLPLPSLGKGPHMVLTFDDGSLSGIVVDPVRSRPHCPSHHSQLYSFCPSSVQECQCEFQQIATCASGKDGEPERVNVLLCSECHSSSGLTAGTGEGAGAGAGTGCAFGDDINFDPCCETFRPLPPPPMPPQQQQQQQSSSSKKDRLRMRRLSGQPPSPLVCGRVAACCLGDAVFSLGGFVVQQGDTFSFVHCTYDLQDFGSGVPPPPLNPSNRGGGGGGGDAQQPSSSYKSGHSHLKTSMTCLKDTPVPNMAVHRFDLCGESSVWRESTRLPCELGDAATAFFRGELWVAGGFTVKYDEDLQLFYQNPVRDVWVYSFSDDRWRRGPSLPPLREWRGREGGGGGYTKATLYVHEGRLFFSGGACLKVNSASESNQIYEYVPNTKVFMLEPQETKEEEEKEDVKPSSSWQLLLDLSYFAAKFKEVQYSVIAVFPTEVTLTRLKVRRDVNAASKFLVRYLNINLGRAEY